MTAALVKLSYLLAAVLFVVGLKWLGSPVRARKGNALSAVGMLIAVPVAAMIGVLTRFAVEQYQASLLYRGTENRGPVGADPAVTADPPDAPPSRRNRKARSGDGNGDGA